MATKKTPKPAVPETAEYPLTVLRLEAENVKRIRAVTIDVPEPTGTVQIAGRNRQGKTSTLDSILMALAGKDEQAALPIRHGEISAKDVVTLQGPDGQALLVVTRTWTAAGSYLTVATPEGQRIDSPQKFLDRLVGAGLAFDPLAFALAKNKEQVELLLDLVKMPRDPREWEAAIKAIYDKRATAHSALLTGRRQLEAFPDPGGHVPTEPIATASVAAELSGAEAHNKAIEIVHTRLEGNAAEIAALERQLAQGRLARTRLENDLEALGDRIDVAPLQQQLAQADAINQAVTARRSHVAQAEAVVALETEWRGLDEQHKSALEERRAMLGAAHFPVEGMGFDVVKGEWCVTLAGIPLTDCSDSERIRTGMAVAMAANPTVRVILIRQGALLDADARQVLDQVARERGYQVWLEIVGAGDDKAFVIEDGGVVHAPDGSGPLADVAAKGPEW